MFGLNNRNYNNENQRGHKNKTDLILILIVAFSLIAIVIYFYFYNNGNNGLNHLKIEKDKPVVYTRYSRMTGKIQTTVPQLNINSTGAEEINDKIIDTANTYLANEKSIMTYNFEISGDILSIVIQVIDRSDTLPVITFQTYNIDLKEGIPLTNDEILSLYNTTTLEVEQKIQAKFEYFFQDERKKKVFDEECDYTCFLYMREIEKYLDKTHYYISKGTLYVYKEFNIYSIYNEENYYKPTDFKIKIKE